MKRMLFNATHPEELRVAIVDGQKLIDLDIETAGREQRKSNIYKAIITRIEPSLEACFVNYGEERHGFLPFKEISKNYFKPGTDVGKARVQDALSEGQELLVQIEKEERGNKGAALTTFISLAGRYLVLMPNNPRGGGVSRRVEGEERQELRDAMDQLDYPAGMSIIARTAGIGRTTEEMQWDLNYLLQLWRAVSDAGGSASGAFLIYQESSLVIRAIRDYLQPDIGEILIDTDEIYEQARQFMSHVMPDTVQHVKRYRDDVPLFSRFQIEHQIETAYSRTVPLPSGGSIVIDHSEALVAVDVNSARATRGTDIEDTATRTNLEAAEEVARQLRLRDLGGLIVIDFIDMESGKNQRDVEQRLKDALHYDRARVQMGKISRFGLMELSRQRLRPALNEGSHVTCPRCNGTGGIRDTESSALHVLRILQEEAMKENTAALHAQVPVDVATFLLNEKRSEIHQIEARLKVRVVLIPNTHIETPHYTLERLRHDDERIDDTSVSYAMVNVPTETSLYQKRDEQIAKPRQEAMVKGVALGQPAPSRADKTAPEQSGTNWLKRLFAWFTASSPASNQQVLAAPEKTAHNSRRRPREERGARSEGGERGDRHGRQRGGRDRYSREERTDARSDTSRDSQNDSGTTTSENTANVLRNSERRPARAGQSDASRYEGRNERDARGGQRNNASNESRERKNRDAVPGVQSASPAVESPVASLPMGASSPQIANANDVATADGEERRNRRPRGRRGRGRGRGESDVESNVEASAGENNDGHRVEPQRDQASAPTMQATPVAQTTFVAQPVSALDTAAIRMTPNNVPIATPVVSPAVIPTAVNPAPAPAPVVSAPVPVAILAATPQTVVTPMPVEKLQGMLSQAGLEMAVTNPNKLAQVRETTRSDVLAPRRPRHRKPLPPLANEPLVKVDTRQNS